MGWWFKKKELDKLLTSEEFLKLSRQGVEFSAAIEMLKSKMELTETNFRSIRGKLNHHILKDPEEEEEKVEPKEEKENYINGDFVGIG